MLIKFKLPMPPSINRLYRAGMGKFWMTDEGVQFKESVRALVMVEKLPTFMPDRPLEVWIDIYPNTNRKRDIDSGIKITLDALQLAGIYANDYQVRKLHLERKNRIPKDCTAYIEVTISDWLVD